MVIGGGARRRRQVEVAEVKQQQEAAEEAAAVPGVETVPTVGVETPEPPPPGTRIGPVPTPPEELVPPPPGTRIGPVPTPEPEPEAPTGTRLGPSPEAAAETAEAVAAATTPTSLAEASALRVAGLTTASDPAEIAAVLTEARASAPFVVDISALPVGPAAGRASSPELAALVDSGASVKDILELAERTPGSFSGGIKELLAPEIEAARVLTGKEQFFAFKSLGFIPEDAEFVATADGWAFTTTETRRGEFVVPDKFRLNAADLAYLRETSPGIADVVRDEGLTAAFKKHGDVLSNVRFERELQAVSPALLRVFREEGPDAS